MIDFRKQHTTISLKKPLTLTIRVHGETEEVWEVPLSTEEYDDLLDGGDYVAVWEKHKSKAKRVE